MGLFDKISTTTSTSSSSYSPLSDYEAWVALLYVCASVDGKVSEVETDTIIKFVLFKKKFSGIDIIPFFKDAMTALGKIGGQRIIDACVPLIKQDDRPTVFALATEVVLSDGILADSEKQILDYLYKAFSLEEALATKIIEVLLIKNQGNTIIA